MKRKCPLADDWKSYSEDKKRDRLFENCPACGVYGCHVGAIDSPREKFERQLFLAAFRGPRGPLNP